MTTPLRIGIDIGGTNLRLALVTANGDVISRRRSPTRVEEGVDLFFRNLTSQIDSLRSDAHDGGGEVVGIGVGVPGLVSADGFIHSSVNLQPLVGCNLLKWLRDRSGVPAAVINDANAIAWGERLFGAGREYGSFLLLTIGTGIGSGLLLDGRLWTGADGVAAEFGHVTVEPEGIPCLCGNRGCLEQYASATAQVRMALQRMVTVSGPTILSSILHELTAEHIAAAARQGDPVATEVIAQAGRAIGIAVASAVNFLNLEALILSGGGSGSFDLLAPRISREVAARSFAIPAQRLTILRGELGDDAGILGSAALAG
ncbi:MAG TPA: ROK family protein [Geobacterales bacterium]|nr:ROK family protein [Geobacterales bacterium]